MSRDPREKDYQGGKQPGKEGQGRSGENPQKGRENYPKKDMKNPGK